MKTGYEREAARGEFPGWAPRFSLQTRVLAFWWSHNLYACFRWLSVFVLLVSHKSVFKHRSGVLNMSIPRLQVPEILIPCSWMRLPEPPRLKTPRRLHAVAWGCIASALAEALGAGEGFPGQQRPGRVFPLERALRLGVGRLRGRLTGRRRWRRSGN